jgi:hypothetical protein
VSVYGVFLVQYALGGVMNQGSLYRGYAMATGNSSYDPADLAAQYVVSSLTVAGQPLPVVTGVTAVAGEAVPGVSVLDLRTSPLPANYLNYAFNLSLNKTGVVGNFIMVFSVNIASGSPSPLAQAESFLATYFPPPDQIININIVGQIAFNVN